MKLTVYFNEDTREDYDRWYAEISESEMAGSESAKLYAESVLESCERVRESCLMPSQSKAGVFQVIGRDSTKTGGCYLKSAIRPAFSLCQRAELL